MIVSKKILGDHFKFVCSKCHEVINPKYIFDSCCPNCKEKMRANDGDSATCMGKIAFGCTANCKHARSHIERTPDCYMFHCKSVGRKVSCVYDGGPYQSNGTLTLNFKYRLACN